MPIPQFTLPQTWALQAGGTAATVLGHYGSQWLFGEGEPYIHTDDDDSPMASDSHSVVISGDDKHWRYRPYVRNKRLQRSHPKYYDRLERYAARMHEHHWRKRQGGDSTPGGGKRRKSNAVEGRSTDTRLIEEEAMDRDDADFLLSIGDVFGNDELEHGGTRGGRSYSSIRLQVGATSCRKYLDIVPQSTASTPFSFTGPGSVRWTHDYTGTRYSYDIAGKIGKRTDGTSGSNYREGDCIKILGLEIEGTVYAAAAGDDVTFVRATLVQAKTPDIYSTDHGSLVFNTSLANAGDLGVNAPVVRENIFNYNILSDATYELRPSVATSVPSKRIKLHMKFKRPYEVTYSQTTFDSTATTDWNNPTTNGLQFILSSGTHTGGTTQHTFIGRCRILFVDGV